MINNLFKCIFLKSVLLKKISHWVLVAAQRHLIRLDSGL